MALYTSDWVRDNIGSFDTLIHTRFPGVPDNYDYAEKENIRTHLVAQAKKWLRKKSIRMLFMPGVQAICLYQFARFFKIRGKKSVAVEHNHLYAEHLRSWIESCDSLIGGEPFKDLVLFEGKMSQATTEVSGVFDIANLDFNGPWSREVVTSLKNLFCRGLLANPSVVFVTINDSEKYRGSYRSHTKKPAWQVLPQRIHRLTKGTDYTCRFLWYIAWNSDGGAKMVSFAFGITAKKQ